MRKRRRKQGPNRSWTHSWKLSDAECSRDDLDDGSESHEVDSLTRRTCIIVPKKRRREESQRWKDSTRAEMRVNETDLGSQSIPR